MNHLINKVLKNPFVNASLYSGVAAILKIGTALLVGKIIAEISGATGILLYGQLLSVVLIVTILSGGAFNQGFIKYIAEYNITDKEKIPKLISTAFKSTVGLSIIISLILIVLSPYLASEVLYDVKYTSIIVVLAVFLIFYTLNNFMLSVLNGFQKFKKISFLNITLSTTGLILTLILSYYLEIYGALLSVVMSQSIVFFVTLFFVRKEFWFSRHFFNEKINYQELVKLLKYGIMAILATVTPAVTAILIRNFITGELSQFDAGIYEFTMRIANSALMLFSMTVSIYYIPRLSEIMDFSNLLKEIRKTLYIVIPLTLITLSSTYFLRDYVILILGSEELLAGSSLIIYILVGVFLKICTQVVGFVFVAKAKIKSIIIIEVLFNICFTLLSIYLVRLYQIEGAVAAFAICNFFYMIGVYITFKNVFNGKTE